MKLVGRALLLAVLVLGCDDGEEVVVAAESAPEPELPEPIAWEPVIGESLDYVSSWDWRDAEQVDGAWVFETDLGYRVGVELGYLASASIMLVPCAEADQPEDSFRAHAVDSDESLLTGPWVEVFSRGQAFAHGRATASGARYCALHWFAAATDQTAEDGHALPSASIEVHGWFESPAGARRDFDAQVSLASGALRSLYADALPEPGAGATVHLLRRPARALDGVELEPLSDSELAFEFLQGIGRSTEVWIE